MLIGNTSYVFDGLILIMSGFSVGIRIGDFILGGSAANFARIFTYEDTVRDGSDVL